MSLNYSDIGLRDEKLEGVENQRRAQPHVAGVSRIELRLEDGGALVSCGAVYAIGADNQVVCSAELFQRWGRRSVVDADTEPLAPLTQDRQQPLPADGGKPVPARRENVAAEMHVDVVPDRKIPGQSLVETRVGVLDPAQRLVRKDNSEPKRVISGVPLPDLDLVLRIQQLDQGRQVKPGRPTADDRDAEFWLRGPQLPSRSRNRCSFPVAVLGSSSANSIARGYL